jgi:hypothetical protein
MAADVDTTAVHLDEHQRRITVRALDFTIQRRQQIEKRQKTTRTWRASELAVYMAETAAMQQVADQLDALSEVKS